MPETAKTAESKGGGMFHATPRSDGKPLAWGKHPRPRGKTCVSLQCPCGLLMEVNVWSWAGVGWKRCPECGRRITRTLDVMEESDARDDRS